MNTRVPILMYHQVSSEVHPKFKKFTVTKQKFTQQMNILRRLKFNSLTFDQIIEYKNQKLPLPSNPIVITFDDCFEAALENAVPVLEELELNAVFYIPTGYVGASSSWMIPRVGDEFKLANWEKIKSIFTKGFEIGSHTINHPRLTELSSDECAKELSDSRTMISDKLGSDVRHMAYPFGFYNEKVTEIVRESGYLTACTTKEYKADICKDLLALPRINVGMEDTLFDFICKIYTSTTTRKITKKEITRIKNLVPQNAKNYIKKLLRYNNSS